MKKENTNNTIYLAPFITVLDIDLEGVLCQSLDKDTENEIPDEGEIEVPGFGGW